MNVEKRRDSARGSRFLLELELQERGGGRQRLSEYVFLRLPGARIGDEDGESPEPPPAASIPPDSRPELCRPLHLAWRQDVMVHFIVPGNVRFEVGGGALMPRAWVTEGDLPNGKPCCPVMLAQWHPPLSVKNQARWVVQFLSDMTALHVHTGDSHFNIILVDFESEDMDVERALRAAKLPR